MLSQRRTGDPQEWVAFKNAIPSPGIIDGYTYVPQIYVPDLDEGVPTGSTVVGAVAPTTRTRRARPATRSTPPGRTFASRSTRLVRVLAHSGPTHQPGFVRVNELEVYPT